LIKNIISLLLNTCFRVLFSVKKLRNYWCSTYSALPQLWNLV